MIWGYSLKHMAARWHLGVIRSILLGGIIPWIVTGLVNATLARDSSPIYKDKPRKWGLTDLLTKLIYYSQPLAMDAMAHVSNHDLAISFADLVNFHQGLPESPRNIPLRSISISTPASGDSLRGKKHRRSKNGNQNIKRGNFYIGNGWLMFWLLVKEVNLYWCFTSWLMGIIKQ